MANLGTTFNANAVQPATGEGQPLIAPGVYPAMMVESEPSQPNEKGNSYLKCVFEICDGPHKGVKLTHRLNLWNQTPKAVEIATQEFSAMCHAVMDEAERSAVSDSSQLHNRPMEVTVAVEGYTKTDGSQGNSNKLTKFARLGTAQSGMASVHSAPQPQPQAQPQPQPQPTQYAPQPQPTQYAPQAEVAPQAQPMPAAGGFAAQPAKPSWAR